MFSCVETCSTWIELIQGGCSNGRQLLERMRIYNNQSKQLAVCRTIGDNMSRLNVFFQVGIGSQKWG